MKFKTNQLYQLTKAYFLETIREPEVLFWGMIFPVLISIGLGLAFMQPAETRVNVMTVGIEVSKLDSLFNGQGKTTQIDNENVYKLRVEDEIFGNFDYSFVENSWQKSIIALKRGEADVIISDSIGKINYHFDPKNSQAQLVYSKISTLIENPNAKGKYNNSSVVKLDLKGVRYIDFLVPGLISFGLMSSLLWGVSYLIIERRQQKLLRRMVATPMRKSYFLFSIMLVRILMNYVEAGILLFFSWLIFDITIQGSIAALIILFFAGNIAFSGISILISSRTSKTEAGSGWINAVQMPMMLLSGIFFSYHNFPDWSISSIKLLPLTALTDGLRSIFNEGAGLIDVLIPTFSLTAFGVICFLIGMKVFKWG